MAAMMVSSAQSRRFSSQAADFSRASSEPHLSRNRVDASRAIGAPWPNPAASNERLASLRWLARCCASLAKMMTVYVAFDLIKRGELKLDQKFTTRPETWKKWHSQGSTMFLSAGEQVSVADLLSGIITLSGNDACVVLAEGIAGTEPAFVALMNQQRDRLGMKGSNFGTANGWPDNGVTYVTARDLGTLLLPVRDRLASRKRWIAYTLKPGGALVVDDGARGAITTQGRSLLPSGLREVRGTFGVGACVQCVGLDGREFARGLVSYSAGELDKIKGRHSREIEAALGYKVSDEIIHRNDLVLLHE